MADEAKHLTAREVALELTRIAVEQKIALTPHQKGETTRTIMTVEDMQRAFLAFHHAADKKVVKDPLQVESALPVH